jgi:hypothetical protein
VDDSVSGRLADFAPLTHSYVIHLVTYLLKMQDRTTGRPRREEGTVFERNERRFLQALLTLQAQLERWRPVVYDLVNPAVEAHALVPGWVTAHLTQLMPDKTVVYLQRLADWRRAGLLPETADDLFDAQYLCCMFFARLIIEARKNAWLPHLSTVEAYACWRQNKPQSPPFSSEIPTLTEASGKTVVKRVFPVEPEPYVVWSRWKGLAWDYPQVLVLEHGVIGWVGATSDEQALQWVSPRERTMLQEQNDVSISQEVLHILARGRLNQTASGGSHAE